MTVARLLAALIVLGAYAGISWIVAREFNQSWLGVFCLFLLVKWAVHTPYTED